MNTEYTELEDNQIIESDDKTFHNGKWSRVPPFFVGQTYQRTGSVILRRIRRKEPTDESLPKPTDESLLLSAALSSLEKAEKELDVLTGEFSKQRYLNHKHLSVLTHIGSMFGTRAYIDANNELTENIDVEILPYLVERIIYSAELLSRKLYNQLADKEEADNK